MRQKAMVQARDTGLSALSGKVILVQETEQDVQAGVLLYTPIYQTTDDHQQFLGWAYSPLRMQDLIGNMLIQKHADFIDRIGIAIYDGPVITEGSLLFTSQFSENPSEQSIQEVRQLQLAGQTWTIKAQSLPGFIKDSAGTESIILFSGALLTLVFTILVKTLVLGHLRMLEAALVLREFKAIVDFSADAIISTTLDGMIVSWNRGAEIIFGYKADEIVDKSNNVLIPPGLIHQELDNMARIARGEAIEHFETTRLHRDGRLLDISATFSPVVDSNGKVIGYANISRDITQQKYAERLHRETEERLTLATIHNGVGIWDWNLRTLEMVWDDSMFALYQMQRDEFSGAIDAWQKSLHPDDSERLNKELQASIMEKMPFDTEFRVLWPNGEIRYIKAVAKVFRDEHGVALRMLGTNIDITAIKQLENELQRQAHIDFLTGVNNRGHFMALAEMELNRTIRYQNPLSILMIDIDYFKRVNDSYGHHTGDRVLQKLAEICMQTLREVDIIGRLGGEEFALLLPETDSKEAFEVAERLRKAVNLANLNMEDNPPLKFTISVGVTSLTNRSKDLELLLDLADKALYEAKKTGRNKVCSISDIQ
jgi:diguanylate cyclase (GGDEF)-like protein/PAS domain S-box-containing protein